MRWGRGHREEVKTERRGGASGKDGRGWQEGWGGPREMRMSRRVGGASGEGGRGWQEGARPAGR